MKKVILLIGAMAHAKIGFNVNLFLSGAMSLGGSKDFAPGLYMREVYAGHLWKQKVKELETAKKGKAEIVEEQKKYMEAIHQPILLCDRDAEGEGIPKYLQTGADYGLVREKVEVSGGRFVAMALGTLDLYHVPLNAHDSVAFGPSLGIGAAFGSIKESSKYGEATRSINTPMLFIGGNVAYKNGNKFVIEGGIYGVGYSEKVNVYAKNGGVDVDPKGDDEVIVTASLKERAKKQGFELELNKKIPMQHCRANAKKALEALPENKKDENFFNTEYGFSLGLRLGAKYYILKDLTVATQIAYILPKIVQTTAEEVTPAVAFGNASRIIDAPTDYELEKNRSIQRSGMLILSIGLSYKVM